MFVQSLDGAWELRQVGVDDCVKARVPGCVHLDLMRAKKIDDPFYGDNENKVAWVHEADWEYCRSFTVDAPILESQRVYLECDGIDTIGEIILNGSTIGRVDNMYIQHRIDVTSKLIPGKNNIIVRLNSPSQAVKPLLQKDPLTSLAYSVPGAEYMRKSPCQWGWDWGPKLPTMGIWRSIRLAAYNIARISDLRIRQDHHANGKVTLNVEVSAEKIKKSACHVIIKVTSPEGAESNHEARLIGSHAKISIAIPKPKLWWPNGYGDQPLYNVEAEIVSNGETVDVFSRRIGLRTLHLEQKKDKLGRSFSFIVNGVRIFAKGGNWVPADSFPSRISDEHYRHLVESVAKANMNMLRAWGGGFYEDERFFDLCDELGILVWQDFMFSCSMYPTHEAFLENARRDVEYNIVRLRNRTCLGLWCGCSEMEWLFTQRSGIWGDEKSAARRRQYLKIFYEMLPSIVSKLDPDTSYWPCSPSSGRKPFDDPNSERFGDGHYWDVWFERAPFTAYRTKRYRFMSEFGFQSMPCIETVRSFAGADDLNMTSRVMESHQKHPAGNGLILHYMAETFRIPQKFEGMCYVSQIMQAEAMRYGVEHWRRNRDVCSGTLYWQINDCWPVLSWSSIDYFGRWKALQYFAKKFFAPILLSVKEEGATAEISVTNDTVKPAKIEIQWSLEKLDGTIVRKSKVKTRVEGCENKIIASLDFSEELAGEAMHDTVLVTDLLINGKPASTCMTAFVATKHLELPEAKIEVSVTQDEDGPRIDVTSDRAARYVYLTIPKNDVIFSDNYFDLPAGRTVSVRVENEIDPAALAKVKVQSVRETY